jgi:hypothetical protein
VTQNGDTTTFGPYAVSVAESPTTLTGTTNKQKSVKKTTIATTAGADDVAQSATPASDEIAQNTSGDTYTNQPGGDDTQIPTTRDSKAETLPLATILSGVGILGLIGAAAFLGIRRLRQV